MENRITVNDYVEEKMAREVARLKLENAKLEFQVLALREENERMKKRLEKVEISKGEEKDGNKEKDDNEEKDDNNQENN